MTMLAPPHSALPAKRAPDPDEELSPAQLRAAPGRPLDAPLRRDMETSFGASFGNVRLHFGDYADRLDADAFTMGDHIYMPSSAGLRAPEGRRLLAHELAHVLQQRSGLVRPRGAGLDIDPHAGLEHEAERAADAVDEGETAPVGDRHAAAGSAGNAGVAQRRAKKAKKAAPKRKRKPAAAHARLAEALTSRLNDGPNKPSPAGAVAGAFLGKGLRGMMSDSNSLQYKLMRHAFGSAASRISGDASGAPKQSIGSVITGHFRDNLKKRLSTSILGRAWSMGKGAWDQASKQRDIGTRREAAAARKATKDKMTAAAAPAAGSAGRDEDDTPSLAGLFGSEDDSAPAAPAAPEGAASAPAAPSRPPEPASSGPPEPFQAAAPPREPAVSITPNTPVQPQQMAQGMPVGNSDGPEADEDEEKE